MADESHKQVLADLDELRTLIEARSDKGTDGAPVLAHVEEVRAHLSDPATQHQAHPSALGLEERILAWEAEHPRLSELATRIARALENAGL